MNLKFIKKAALWGLLLWFIGYVLGFIFYAFVPPAYIGWAIMPIGTAITVLVLVKKIKGNGWKENLQVSVTWTLIAMVLDYLFIVSLLKSSNYYKPDVYAYYTLTFALPMIVSALKTKPLKT